jgi:hypothetical protein
MAGQQYEVHGQSGAIYNLLTFPRMNLNSLFKRIGAAAGRRPHQLRAARAFGVSAYKAQQAIQAATEGGFSGLPATALDHFHLAVKSTTAWAHPGNYLGAVGVLVNGNRLLVEAGAWEKGFKRVELNGEALAIGSVMQLVDAQNKPVTTEAYRAPAAGAKARARLSAEESAAAYAAKMESLHAALAASSSTLEQELEPELIAKVDALVQSVAALNENPNADERGQDIGFSKHDDEGAAQHTQPQHTVFRFNSHQLAIRLPYISLVLTNSDGFVNLEQIELHDDASKAHEQIEGLLGQSHAIHHMAANGTKLDKEAHVQQQLELSVAQAQPSSRRAALLTRMRDLSRTYKHHSADSRYHIDDYFVESQNLFATDFVENRYSL